jgi:putative oxidoreductase
MTTSASEPGWTAIAILLGRLILLVFFAMAFYFKFTNIDGTAGYIASVGFPIPTALAWLAAIFEVLLVLGFLTGAYFAETCLLAGLYVTFLDLAFHGPSHWHGEFGQYEFTLFFIHFLLLAGFLFAAAHGPGRILASRKTIIGRYPA